MGLPWILLHAKDEDRILGPRLFLAIVTDIGKITDVVAGFSIGIVQCRLAQPRIGLHSYTSRRGNVAGADASRNRIYGVCGDDHVTLNHVSVLESDGGMVGININDSAGGLQLRGTAGTAPAQQLGDLMETCAVCKKSF
jgi:hypothetical protein